MMHVQRAGFDRGGWGPTPEQQPPALREEKPEWGVCPSGLLNPKPEPGNAIETDTGRRKAIEEFNSALKSCEGINPEYPRFEDVLINVYLRNNVLRLEQLHDDALEALRSNKDLIIYENGYGRVLAERLPDFTRRIEKILGKWSENEREDKLEKGLHEQRLRAVNGAIKQIKSGRIRTDGSHYMWVDDLEVEDDNYIVRVYVNLDYQQQATFIGKLVEWVENQPDKVPFDIKFEGDIDGVYGGKVVAHNAAVLYTRVCSLGKIASFLREQQALITPINEDEREGAAIVGVCPLPGVYAVLVRGSSPLDQHALKICSDKRDLNASLVDNLRSYFISEYTVGAHMQLLQEHEEKSGADALLSKP